LAGQERGPRLPHRAPARLCLTIFAVVKDIHFALLCPQQGLRQAGHSTAWGIGTCEKVAGAWSLHHLHSGVAEEFTEAIVAVNDGAVLHLSIGDQELTTWVGRREVGRRWWSTTGVGERKILGTDGSREEDLAAGSRAGTR
jgi:hypothetical protein